MNVVHNVFSFVCDVFITPFVRSDPIWPLLLISLLTSIFVLWIYKLFSNQKEIKHVKDQIKAYLLEVRLFTDDPVQTGRSIAGLLLKNLRYLQLNIVPFMVMVVPIVLLIIHLDMRFGRRPLRVGEPTIVKVSLSSHPGLDPIRDIRVEVSEGLKIETPPVYIPTHHELSWRVSASAPGIHPLHVTIGTEGYTTTVIASDHLVAVNGVSVRHGFFNRLVHPTHPPLRLPNIESIEIVYPQRTIHLWSQITLHWIILFFILTIVLGFSLKGVLRVQL